MTEKDKAKLVSTEKRKAADQEAEPLKDLKKVVACAALRFRQMNLTVLFPSGKTRN
jgi:hypothetical protein